MPILPLPQFEADMEAARKDREVYERLEVPKTLVVRFGSMRLVGEFPYAGDVKPGCGSKIVVRTHRGTEIGEMLTSTCPNAGCSKSVTRQEMLQYIENSGGKDYPFFTDGRALRVATAQDMAEQSRIDGLRPAMLRYARDLVREMGLPMKVVEAEPILGGERLTFYFASEDRIDFRDLVPELAREFGTRIDLRQVGARDEARLIADYERCGQHCCCKQFLKVLKPISIKAAKTQKATLDPLKISGRCGRLMCCLRYEDETYNELVKRLPKMKRIVGTPHGVGMVVDRQILTQLVLVRLEHDGTQVAVPVEELCPPEEAPKPGGAPAKAPDPLRGASPEKVAERTERAARPERGERQERFRDRAERPREPARPDVPEPPPESEGEPPALEGAQRKRKRRRRRRGGGSAGDEHVPEGPERDPGPAAGAPPEGGSPGEGQPRKKRRRRRGGRGRRPGSEGEGPAGEGSGAPGPQDG